MDGCGIRKLTSIQIQTLNVDPGFLEILTQNIYTGLWFFKPILILHRFFKNFLNFRLHRRSFFINFLLFHFWFWKRSLLFFLKLLDLKRRKMIFQIILVFFFTFVFNGLFDFMHRFSLFIFIVFQDVIAEVYFF